MSDLKNCPKCGNTRHVRIGKKFVRCKCVVEEMRERKMKSFGFSGDYKSTSLVEYVKTSLVLVGPYNIQAPFIAGVYHDVPLDFTVRTEYVYELSESFLGHTSKEEEGLEVFTIPDLLVLLLGFTELTNRSLGNMIQHVFRNREIRGKATWFGIPRTTVNLKGLYGKNVVQIVDELDKIDLTKVEEG